MHFIKSLLFGLTVSATTPVVDSFAPRPTVIPTTSMSTTSTSTSSTTTTSQLHSTAEEIPDYTGKTIYQRSFYRLSPGSDVSHPNALVLEERLRFQPDPQNPGYILPIGPRTFIFRIGTNQDEITDELYRVHLGDTHNGPGTMDTSIATMLYIASNPELVQGKVLQLGCEDGAASLVGCMGAKWALLEKDGAAAAAAALAKSNAEEELELLTVPKHKALFPPRMEHLTLSEEGEEELKTAYNTIKGLPKTTDVSLKEVAWSNRVPGRRSVGFYRLIVGSDMDFSYPDAKQLARTVGNYLLPSNEFALASTEDAVVGSSGGGGSFGALGMDLGSSPASSSSSKKDPATEVDPKVPPTFVHVNPDARENTMYLRQFLEKGYRMTVNTGYLKMQRLQFVFQTLPQDAPEKDIEDLDLELKDETDRSYQSLTAMHHPDYAGEGSGEYFFPLETGEYEGGSRSTYLEPEEESSPW